MSLNEFSPSEVSIAIPTIEMNSLTQKCVKECLEHCPGASIFVVVDSENDEVLSRKDINVIVSGNCTIAAKRNLAAQASSSQYLAFIDSDASPRAGWTTQLIFSKSGKTLRLWVDPMFLPRKKVYPKDLWDYRRKVSLFLGLIISENNSSLPYFVKIYPHAT